MKCAVWALIAIVSTASVSDAAPYSGNYDHDGGRGNSTSVVDNAYNIVYNTVASALNTANDYGSQAMGQLDHYLTKFSSPEANSGYGCDMFCGNTFILNLS